MNKLSHGILWLGLAFGLCAGAARAGSAYYSVSGTNGYSQTYAGISIPSTCSISTTITLDRYGATTGYGSGISYIYRGSTQVLAGYLNIEENYHVSQTWSTSDQAAGSYQFTGVCALGAPKQAVITASFNW